MYQELVEIGFGLRLICRLYRLSCMRGDEHVQDEMFSYVTLEQRVPADHPLREVRRLTDLVIVSLNDEFHLLCSASGCPSIAPEYVLRALLLQAFYSVRQLVKQLDYKGVNPTMTLVAK